LSRDTIDVSNLNRQFLFRPEHVGQSKAKIAAEAVTKYNGHLNIKWHHGNIKDPQFGTSFISSFTIILNALDNVDARRHVNRLALASNVPLIGILSI
jgi:ubiquitin-like 1-activating enzyme E1 B